MIIDDIVYDLIKRTDEEEWFDFKENWFNPVEIGEYISAISNAAAVCGKSFHTFLCNQLRLQKRFLVLKMQKSVI